MRSSIMMSEQKSKAQARQSARSAPQAAEDVAERAIEDAKAVKAHSRKAQKATVIGENVHHPLERNISEFDDPADNTCKDRRT